jgi:lysophospholipase L1-like esterase
MDTFRTQIPFEIKSFDLHHQHYSMVFGSCFAEHIGERLCQRHFNVLVNPFGIVFNPAAMHRQVRQLAGMEAWQPVLHERDGLWHSFEHHGRFSQTDRAAALTAMQAQYEAAAAHIRQTDRIILTFGTADVFVHVETGDIVSNCHKFPAAHFLPQRLTVAEITTAWVPTLEYLHQQRPDLQVLLTVSPVRHTRGGMIENQISKATLILACAELCARLPFVQYFPAYELVLDDLRDYRFYADDMVHPSEKAVQYVWEHFMRTCVREDARALAAEIEKINRAMAHRPFNPDTPQHQAFLAHQQAAWASLVDRYPFLSNR